MRWDGKFRVYDIYVTEHATLNGHDISTVNILSNNYILGDTQENLGEGV